MSSAKETYQELVKKALASGHVTQINTQVVHKNDSFEYTPSATTGAITHTVNISKPRGEMSHVYSILKLRGGDEQTVLLTEQEIREDHQTYSANPDNWDKHPVAYWKKTAIRTVLKPLEELIEGLSEVLAEDNKDFNLVDLNTGEVVEAKPAIPTKPVERPAMPTAKPEPAGSPSEPPHPADATIEAIAKAVGGTVVAGSPAEPLGEMITAGKAGVIWAKAISGLENITSDNQEKMDGARALIEAAFNECGVKYDRLSKAEMSREVPFAKFETILEHIDNGAAQLAKSAGGNGKTEAATDIPF